MICTCPNCQKLYETTTESANSPDRKERLCADCYKSECMEDWADPIGTDCSGYDEPVSEED